MQTHWRLALMFDALDGDLAALETGLRQFRDGIALAADSNAVRIGVTFPDTSHYAEPAAHDLSALRTVDGAIEVTIPNGGENAVSCICAAMRPIVEKLAEPGSIEVMAGATHFMVPVCPGDVFLSLSFRRHPDMTVPPFRDWWLNQHSKIAIPVLGKHLLAYDQVHVDTAVTRTAADALGVPFVDYDAYDNLTFKDRQGFVDSISDIEGMTVIAQDEVGRIDDSTRRHALLRDIGR